MAATSKKKKVYQASEVIAMMQDSFHTNVCGIGLPFLMVCYSSGKKKKCTVLPHLFQN